jgi:leucyl aminopeptidase
MEFKAIIDAKARTQAACAVVGVYEDGELGMAARRVDAQLNGMIGKLRGDGDFSAKLGDVLLLPAPAGAAAARVLLIGLGTHAAFGRKQYRKALQSTVHALGKTGADDATVYLALEQVADLDVQYRARAVAEVFCAQLYKIPDLKTAAKPKAPRLSSLSVAVADARGSKAATEGLRIGAALGLGTTLSRDLANLPPNVHPAYSARVRKPTGLSEHRHRIGRERIKAPGRRMAVTGVRLAPHLIVGNIRRRGDAADLSDRQGHY